jgi:hypothetical protein
MALAVYLRGRNEQLAGNMDRRTPRSLLLEAFDNYVLPCIGTLSYPRSGIAVHGISDNLH